MQTRSVQSRASALLFLLPSGQQAELERDLKQHFLQLFDWIPPRQAQTNSQLDYSLAERRRWLQPSAHQNCHQRQTAALAFKVA